MPLGAAAALRIASPGVADCPSNNATTITKQISLKDAAAAHIAKVSPKGGFLGDSVKVVGTWKPIKAPITITLHLEVIPPPANFVNWVDRVNQIADERLTPVTIKSGAQAGTTVNFKVDVRQREASEAPSPCYHQILLTDTPGFRSFVDDATDRSGAGWCVGDRQHRVIRPRDGPFDGAQRPLHRLLPDELGSEKIPLPRNGLEGDALQAALPKGISKDAGRVASKPWYPNDIMSITSKGFTDSELRFFSRTASIDIHSNPGDILVNKNPADQNMITAYPFDLLVPPRGTATANGLTAYCINEHLHIPDVPGGFDVLGPAGEQPGPGAAALQKLADVVGREVPAYGSLAAVDAFWRISDDCRRATPMR